MEIFTGKLLSCCSGRNLLQKHRQKILAVGILLIHTGRIIDGASQVTPLNSPPKTSLEIPDNPLRRELCSVQLYNGNTEAGLLTKTSGKSKGEVSPRCFHLW